MRKRKKKENHSSFVLSFAVIRKQMKRSCSKDLFKSASEFATDSARGTSGKERKRFLLVSLGFLFSGKRSE